MRKEPPARTHGGDGNKRRPICKDHQAGVRTGIKDYCCCCNPCLYGTVNDDAAEGPVHCCHCNPRIISIKYTPNYPVGECCRSVVVPMFGSKELDGNSRTMVRYTGTILGHNVAVYISSNPIPEVTGKDYDDLDCRWTISIPTLSVLEEIEIDHTNVTCLGVPAINVSGVSAFGGTCTGSLSLVNFDADRVPFLTRQFADEFPDGNDLLVPLAYPCNQCTEVARYLCLSGARFSVNDEGYVEFSWDTDYIPEEGAEGLRLGRWTYTPPGGGYTEKIYLVQSSEYEDCMLYFDFKSPDFDTGNESFDPVPIDPITGCGCDFKQLVTGGTPSEPLGFTLRAGRCSCLEYHCGTCRCVPRYLCAQLFTNNTFYNNILFTWSEEVLGWVSSGGADLDGNTFNETLTIFLTRAEDGSCQFEFSRYGFTVDPLPASCGLVINGNFSGWNDSNDDYFDLVFATSYDGECDSLVSCGDASPCGGLCGSHPEKLSVSLYGYSDPDLDEPGITDECLLDIDLAYWYQVAFPGAIEITCGYRGYATLACADGITYRLLRVELSGGTLSIELFNVNGGQAGFRSFPLDYETCDPYYAEYFEALGGPNDCVWSCDLLTIQRFEVEITE